MEAQLVVQCKSPFSTTAHRRLINREKHPLPILFVLTKAADGVKKLSNSKSVHNDNWFDNIAIHHLSHAVQSTIGLRNYKSGYESLVEAAMATSHNFNSIQQCEVVIKALERAFPKPILAMIRALIPNSKFTREFFAVFTTVFFKWLVGPSEVRDSELNGRTERNVVHIKKCRFLESSNCVGMCINLCKIPSQTFIKDSLGMPINMVPNVNTLVSYINMKTSRDAWVYESGKGQIVFFIHHSKQDFDDMSCEMIYGQDPPPTTEDPVFKQPCYTLCKVKQRHSINCSS